MPNKKLIASLSYCALLSLCTNVVLADGLPYVLFPLKINTSQLDQIDDDKEKLHSLHYLRALHREVKKVLQAEPYYFDVAHEQAEELSFAWANDTIYYIVGILDLVVKGGSPDEGTMNITLKHMPNKDPQEVASFEISLTLKDLAIDKNRIRKRLIYEVDKGLNILTTQKQVMKARCVDILSTKANGDILKLRMSEKYGISLQKRLNQDSEGNWKVKHLRISSGEGCDGLNRVAFDAETVVIVYGEDMIQLELLWDKDKISFYDDPKWEKKPENREKYIKPTSKRIACMLSKMASLGPPGKNAHNFDMTQCEGEHDA